MKRTLWSNTETIETIGRPVDIEPGSRVTLYGESMNPNRHLERIERDSRREKVVRAAVYLFVLVGAMGGWLALVMFFARMAR